MKTEDVFHKIDIALHKISVGMTTKVVTENLGYGHYSVKMIELEEQPCICKRKDCPELKEIK